MVGHWRLKLEQAIKRPTDKPHWPRAVDGAREGFRESQGQAAELWGGFGLWLEHLDQAPAFTIKGEEESHKWHSPVSEGIPVAPFLLDSYSRISKWISL